jgi:hypothetical protein
MSCLQVSVSVLPLELKPLCIIHNTPLNLQVSALPLVIKPVVKTYDKSLNLQVNNVTNHLKVTCGIVCSIGDVHYLRVSPEEVQWITPDMDVIYTVESDTSWSILVN